MDSAEGAKAQLVRGGTTTCGSTRDVYHEAIAVDIAWNISQQLLN
jgi:hypothetical protein